MATVQALRDRLASRLGLSTVTAIEQARLNEALYAGLSRVYTDKAPGYAYSELTAETFGSSAVTISSHTANTSSLTLSAIPTGTAVGDVLVVGAKSWLIYDYGSLAIDVGAAIKASLTGETGTIYHRTVQLPTTAQVLEVVDLTNNVELKHQPGGLSLYGLGTQGQPAGFDQRYSRQAGTSYISLWPVPTSAIQIAIKQGYVLDSLSTDTDIEGTEPFFDAILSQAVLVWRGLQSGGPAAMEWEAASKGVLDSNTAAKSSATSAKPQSRSGISARGRR